VTPTPQAAQTSTEAQAPPPVRIPAATAAPVATPEATATEDDDTQLCKSSLILIKKRYTDLLL
jgi:hypothetical protein